MTTAHLLKIMAEVVAESQSCVLEVVMQDNTAMAHLYPLDEWRAEMEEGFEDDED